MRVAWDNLAEPADGAIAAVCGYALAAGSARTASTFLLVPEARCCAVHAPADPSGAVEVFAAQPIPTRAGLLRLTGEWRVRTDDPTGWRYQLHAARPLDPPGWQGVTRRRALMAGPLMCLGVAAGSANAQDRQATAKAIIAAGPTIDIHSHAGGVANVKRITIDIGYTPIAAPMREGGMTAICLAVVSDGPTHHLEDKRIRPYRDPAAGELYTYGMLAFDRVHALVKREGLRIVATRADLNAGTPGVVISAEGADFLEGRLERVEEAYRRWTLRHLQLTHYRVNELGDIQTEPPVHGGLTDFGAEAIRCCNRLGIVVDVAHGTLDLVKRAALVSTKPLVLSHTSLTARPGPHSRQISAEHAKVIAGTGGVIGVWPVADYYPTMTAMAVGMARLADVVGVDHVGLGTDLRGLVGASTIGEYNELPLLAEALLGAGFSQQDAGKILGGNYARVFAASLAL